MREDAFSWVRRIRRVCPPWCRACFCHDRVRVAATAVHAQQPDPAGIATGDKTNAVDAGGNAFVVPEPTDKADPGLCGEEEGVRRISGPGGEGAAGGQARRLGRPRPDRDQLRLDAEHRLPRAVHAGRIRAAHLRARAEEERRAPDDAELRGLRVRVPGLLRCAGTRSSSAPSRSTRRPPDLGGTPTLNQFLHRQRPVGLPGRQGVLPERARLRRRQQRPDAVRSRLHGNGRLHHRRLDLRADQLLGIPALRDLRRRAALSDLRLLGLGRRLDVAARARRWAWDTATWTSPDRPSCTPSAASARWRWRSCSVRGSASTARTASRARFRPTTSCSS